MALQSGRTRDDAVDSSGRYILVALPALLRRPDDVALGAAAKAPEDPFVEMGWEGRRLVGVSLKDGDGIELIKELRGLLPDLPTLAFSMQDEQIYGERALRAGARGFIMKQESPQTVLDAIRQVLKGSVYVSDRTRDSLILMRRDSAGKQVHDEQPMDRLTDRELEIFRMIGSGLSVREIATKLILSSKTVEAHREHITARLGFRSSAELAHFAIRNAPGTP